MPVTKQNILDSVEFFTAEQLVKNIKDGIVTFTELVTQTEGNFKMELRNQVTEELNNLEQELWTKIEREKDKQAIDQYLTIFQIKDKIGSIKYPDAPHLSQVLKINEKIENNPFSNPIFQPQDPIGPIDTGGNIGGNPFNPDPIVEEPGSPIDNTDDESLDWSFVNKEDLDSLQNFIKSYPNGRFIKEANRKINEIISRGFFTYTIDDLIKKIQSVQIDKMLTTEQKDNNIINEIQKFISISPQNKYEFLDKFREDHNIISSGIVKRLIGSNLINYIDLQNLNIDNSFIQKIFKEDTNRSLDFVNAFNAEKIEKINKVSTEIYFWGIPSSGKSCALGAILSVAGDGSVALNMDADTGSQGYGYMNSLKQLFRRGEVGELLSGTPIDAFYEMGFDLTDHDKKIHPITCIDMAGELMTSMFLSNTGEELSSVDVEMLDTLQRILTGNRSVNRKLHVFVVEYGAENRYYKGHTQKEYLDGALSFIKNTDIFNKDTDAIYIMITKADKIKDLSFDKINAYIDENYKNFINGLQIICQDNEINGGKIEKIAFSLGDVCFQNYCRFNPAPAENVVKILMKRTAYYKKGKIANITKKLKS